MAHSQDAAYILGAFRQCYGMDLIRIDYLHYWEFRSLMQILETDNVDLGRQKANTNFETIQTHLDSQENPHGVTAVQAGALPLAAWSTVWEAGQDLNTVLTTGTYAAPTNAIAAACTNLP